MMKIKAKYSMGAFLYLIPLSLGICIVGNVAVNLMPFGAINDVSIEITKMINEGQLWKAMLIVGLLSPLIEELFFRFFFYYIVKRFFGYKVAIVASAIAFAVAHMNLQQGLYAFFAGLFLGAVRYKYDSIFCPFFMHFLMNLFAVLFGAYFMGDIQIRDGLFMIFIGLAMLLLSVYRINIIFKKEGF